MAFDGNSAYRILGVAPDATDEEIRTAYRERAIRFGPEAKGGGNDRMLQRLTAAYELLKSPKRRRDFDAAHRAALSTRGNSKLILIDSPCIPTDSVQRPAENRWLWITVACILGLGAVISIICVCVTLQPSQTLPEEFSRPLSIPPASADSISPTDDANDQKAMDEIRQRLKSLPSYDAPATTTVVNGQQSSSSTVGGSNVSPSEPNQVAQTTSASGDNATNVVALFKGIAVKVSSRYTKPEGENATAKDALGLTVVAPPDNISVRQTDDLITPFKGEVRGVALLSVPGSWFNDGDARTLQYNVTWPFIYRDSKWIDDKVRVVPDGEPADDPDLSPIAEVVRLRVASWGLILNDHAASQNTQ